MKKIFYLIAAATMFFAVSCSEEDPTVSFGKQAYVLLSDGTTDVDVVVSEAPQADLKVSLSFTGSAVKGTDYTVSSDYVTIPAGSKTASVTVSALNNIETSVIKMAVIAPAGYALGTVPEATVAVEAKEKIICSFETSSATVLDSYKVKMILSGVESGSSFAATSDMEIPVVISGSTDKCSFDGKTIKVQKGSNFGTLVVKAGDVELGDDATVEIAFDKAGAGARFVEGENSKITLNITGVLKLSSLVGTWKFDSIFDQEDVEYFYEEMEDDVTLLPLDNEGFTFTISEVKDDEGTVTGYKFVPSATGAFANYFREADITYCAPVNPCSGAELLGNYCAVEENMFVAMITDDAQYNTYFELSKANRAFSDSEESIGKGVISLYLDKDGGLTMSIHDYDTPPFGEMWWDDTYFDADIFGFASLFTRAD